MKYSAFLMANLISLVVAMTSLVSCTPADGSHVFDYALDQDNIEVSSDAQTIIVGVECTRAKGENGWDKWGLGTFAIDGGTPVYILRDGTVMTMEEHSAIAQTGAMISPISSPSYYRGEWFSFSRLSADKLQVLLDKNVGPTRTLVLRIGGYTGPTSAVLTITQAGTAPTKSAPFTVKALYKDNEYTTSAYTLGDSVVYESQEFNRLVRELKNQDEVETFVLPDGTLWFTDAQDAARDKTLKMAAPEEYRTLKAKPAQLEHAPMSRSASDPLEGIDASALAYCSVWDDNSYQDNHLIFNIDDYSKLCEYQYLRDLGMNDKISSVAMYNNISDSSLCAVMTVWEDSYFNFGDNDRTKHRINFVTTSANRTGLWPNLRQIPCINSGNTWNDRISSLSFHIGYASSLPKQY